MMAGNAEAHADDLSSWVERACALARQHPGVDAFEVRADIRDSRRVVTVDGALRVSRINRMAGLGLRVFAGGGRSYAYANELDDARLLAMVERAVRAAEVNGGRRWKSHPPALASPRKASYVPQVKAAPIDATPEEMAAVALRADAGAKEAAPQVTRQVSFGALTSRVIATDSAGSWREIEGILSTLLVQGVARDAGRFADSGEWRGGERGLGDYEDEGGPEQLGREAALYAIEALEAKPLTAGRQRVLTDSHMSGLLAHESFGHLTEHDLVASGWSVLRDRLGETLAAPNVTIEDAPFVDGVPKQGVRVPLDDEGTPGRVVKLLDEGRLASYMHTRDSAAASGVAPTGNGRALDARFAPIVRMRNTYFAPGSASFDEALAELRDGVYLIGARGGAPRSDGSFMFTAKRGYIVEKGEKVAPVRSVSIHGNVLDFLKNVQLTTRDFRVHTNYFGGCGKWDQSFLHVGTGGPHVLVSDALLGGQAA